MGVDDQVLTARKELLPGAGQAPPLPAMFREGSKPLNEFPEDLYQDVAGFPRSASLTVQLMPNDLRNITGGGRLRRLSRFLQSRRRGYLALCESTPAQEGRDSIGGGSNPAEVLDLFG